MKKTIPALLAAFLITAIIAASMLVIGQDALAKSSAAAAPAINDNAAAQITQLLVSYQTREIQYNQQLQSANDQIKVANQLIATANHQIRKDELLIQQNKAILAELQNRGLITIAEDGTITIH